MFNICNTLNETLLSHSIFSFEISRPKTAEYIEAMKLIQPIVDEHHKTLVKGAPQLNYCDPAVMVITAHPTHYEVLPCNLVT